MKEKLKTIFCCLFGKKEENDEQVPRGVPRLDLSFKSKSAILIGLNYPGSCFTLRGCINDVKNGEKLLKEHGYKTKLCTDNEISSQYDVLEALNELKKSKSKTVFFHYSGHGTQVKDKDGDEMDGKDEALYSKNGHLITDDEINSLLALYPKDKTVFLVFDCCHSGTIVDLPYIATTNGYNEEIFKKNVKAKVICISGCHDPQTSADVTNKGLSYGALSATLYSLLRKNGEITWRKLYEQLVLEMSRNRYSQIPQLTASDPKLFDQVINL
jgi:metacaspase-1